jgi:5-hydroxyisourate hydrolase
MSYISTHILDTTLGQPAVGVPVRLEHRQQGDWQAIGAAQTDADGRCKQIVPDSIELGPGIYRLAFDTASYFGSQRVSGLYPVVEITFEIRAGEGRFHIPLLLSPNGFTTYRGS